MGVGNHLEFTRIEIESTDLNFHVLEYTAVVLSLPLLHFKHCPCYTIQTTYGIVLVPDNVLSLLLSLLREAPVECCYFKLFTTFMARQGSNESFAIVIAGLFSPAGD